MVFSRFFTKKDILCHFLAVKSDINSFLTKFKRRLDCSKQRVRYIIVFLLKIMLCVTEFMLCAT